MSAASDEMKYAMPRNVKNSVWPLRHHAEDDLERNGSFVVSGRYQSRRFGIIDLSEGTLSG